MAKVLSTRQIMIGIIIFLTFRLQKYVLHPNKLLYIGEQILWKSIRICFGNKATPINN